MTQITATATSSSITATATSSAVNASVSSSSVSASAGGGIGPQGPAGNAGGLGDLLDVQLVALSGGDVLRYSSGKWRNSPETNLTDGGNY